MTREEEAEARKRYAAALIRTPNPLAAGLEIFPENTTWAAWIAVHWSKHPEVVEEKERLKAGGADKKGLADKADLARAIWDRMSGPCLTDDFTKLGKLYAEINGMIEKPAPPQVTVTNIIPKCIEIPNHGTNDEWEAIAEKQQKDLLSVSRSKS